MARPRALPPHTEVAVIGAGFSGIGAAVRLLRAGYDDLVVLERGDRVGGTWRDNSYPGCACDVPSNLYSFSWALEPGWTRSYAPWNEIQAYLERVADEFGVRPHLHLSTVVRSSRWDDAAGLWRLDTSAGPLTARFLLAGVGPLAEPRLPDVPGLDRFAGAAFHSARWDHDVDLRGKRVAVVGTGASAIQIVPAIVDQVTELVLLQRTAAWVIPRHDRSRPPWERRLYEVLPSVQRAARGLTFLGKEIGHGSFARPGVLRQLATWQATRLREEHITDPDLRAALTPPYELGCKRVLVSDDYFAALARDHVSLVTGGLAEVLPDAVVDDAGTKREVDVIVFSTGFHVTDLPAAETTIGRAGVRLADAWHGSPVAHRGVTVAGFPNLFLLLGPGTGLGHNSVVTMIEAQVSYVVRALRQLQEVGATVLEVREEAQRRWDDDVQAALAPTVWASGGCRSWYQDATGRVAAIWPSTVLSYQRLMRRFDADSYRYSRPASGARPPVDLDEIVAAGRARATISSRSTKVAAVGLATREVVVAADDGIELHAEVRGPEPDEPATTLVLVHGWTLDRRLWHRQVDAMAGEHPGIRILAVDLRGHGASGVGSTDRSTIAQLAADLSRVVNAVAPDGPLVLAGHSMGGMAVLALAEAGGEVLQRLDGVLLVDTSAGALDLLTYRLPRPLGRGFHRLIPVALERGRRDEAAGRARRTVPGIERWLSFGRAPDPEDVRLATAMGRATRADVTADFHVELLAHDRVAALQALAHVPVVVMVGNRDRLTPPAHARQLADALPDAELVVLGGAGHMLPMERPDEVNTALAGLVTRTEVPA